MKREEALMVHVAMFSCYGLTPLTNQLTSKAVLVPFIEAIMELYFVSHLKAVCHAFDWVIMTLQRIGNLNG